MEVFRQLGLASVFMDDQQRRTTMPKACEVAKEVLRRGAVDLVQEAGGMPMISSKSCDGTPITVKHRSTHVLPGGKKVKWSGLQCNEFLVSNQFLRVDLGGGGDGVKTRVLLAEPTPLLHGKTATAILVASRQHWQRLREFGALRLRN